MTSLGGSDGGDGVREMDEIVGLALDMECPVLSESDIQQEFGSPNPSRWAPLMSYQKII